MVAQDALPEMVYQIQARTLCFMTSDSISYIRFSYIMAASLDGGTQVISFILNFVSTLLHVPFFMFTRRSPSRLSSVLPVQLIASLPGGGMVRLVESIRISVTNLPAVIDITLSADRCALPDN